MWKRLKVAGASLDGYNELVKDILDGATVPTDLGPLIAPPSSGAASSFSKKGAKP